MLSTVPMITGIDRSRLHQLAVVKPVPRVSKPTGFLKSAEALNSTTIRVQFKTPITRPTASRLRYEIAGLQVTNIQLARDGRTALLTTTPQDDTAYTVRVSQVQGSGGKAHLLKQATALVTGKAATRVLDVKPVSDTSLLVTYSRPMGAQAALLGNYSVTAEGAQPVQVTGAHFTDSTNTVVEVQTTPQSYGTYSFSASNVTDTAGQQVYLAGRSFTGNPKGAVVDVAATSYTRVVVAFNEPMADNALAPQHYSLQGPSGFSLLVTDAKFDGSDTMVVVLTTAPQANVPYLLKVSNVTDLSGDGLAKSTGNFTGIAAPTLTKAVPTQANRLVLTFSGAVGDSALAPSTYKIEQLNDSGTIVVGTLPISSAGFVGGQRTVVELVTPVQNNAKYRIWTTDALTDVAGSPLPIAQQTFQGLGSRPSLVGATSTGPASMLVTFSKSMSDDALAPSSYAIRSSTGAPLPVLDARFVGTENRVVQLTTGPQASVDYTIVSIAATDLAGISAVVPADSTVNTFAGRGVTAEAPAVNGPPRVIGAASLSNTEVIVAFSEPMADNAAKPEHYYIVQENVNPEAGALLVTGAEFYGGDPSVVKLTTLSQNELTYRVTVVSATDLAGNAMAPAVLAGGLRIDPSSSAFPGTPPRAEIPGSPATLKDIDGDGLPDNVEMRGWLVTVHNVDGTTTTRGVTSDPFVKDTDGDGLSDAQEANLRYDPRSPDTDDDQLTDYAEFNEIFSNGLDQDTDHDGADDYVEFAVFSTSPFLDDTDGDQKKDGDEIFSNRNPRVAELPRPEITVGDINLTLNVHFTETNAKETRDLESQSVTSTLSRSDSQTHTNQYTGTVEAHAEHSLEETTELGYVDGAIEAKASITDTFVVGGSAGFTYQRTDESASETTRSYEKSLETQNEVTSGFTVERDVTGAVMQVAVSLRNVSNLAYRVKNLQVTAFIQDPQDHSRLTPLATLVPDSEPADGFTLGPLVTDRGPIIFSNTTIVPKLVESLMANPSGLIFRISNYDIINEDGRNFAFISQDVVERTTQVVIDFGGATSLVAKASGQPIDPNQPGDETEIYRVATSAGRVIDTDGDGTINESARRETATVNFSGAGNVAYEDGGEAKNGWGDFNDLLAGNTLSLFGNRWRAVNFPFTVTRDTVLDFDLSARNGEIIAIGLDDDLVAGPDRIFQLQGSQTDYGIQAFHRPQSSTLDHYSIPIGQYKDFLGENKYLTFVVDNDQNGPNGTPNSGALFRNVTLTRDYEGDHRVIFDADGNEVGITLAEGLSAIGLTRYEARLDLGKYLEYEPGGTKPVDFTNQDDKFLASYSTFIDDRKVVPDKTDADLDSVFYKVDPRFVTGLVVQVADASAGLEKNTDYYIRNLGGGSYSFFYSVRGAASNDASQRVDLTGNVTAGVFGSREKIYRIRGLANDPINQKYWEIISPLGIDQVTDLKNLILKTDAPVSLNYVQDLDHDGMPADLEFFLGTSDSPMITGAVVPGTTDFKSEMSVTYGSDPGFSPDPADPTKATGTLVRVTETGGGLMAGENYTVQYLRNYAYSFYKDGVLVPLTGNITAGIFPTARPASTDANNASVTFDADPKFATATVVQVTDAGGGLAKNTDYYIRNLGGGSYSFYDSAEHATAGIASTAGRIDLSADITASVFSPTAHGRDTDGDGLDDRFEALIGWTVSTPLRTYKVFSAPNRADSNFDSPKKDDDTDKDGILDRREYDGSDGFAAPAGWTDKNGNGLRDRFEIDQKAAQNGVPDYVLDPIRRDTDGDGIMDATEIIGFKITPLGGKPADAYPVSTNPNSPDTDSDTFTDGFERFVGLNPTNGNDKDEDGDGLPDQVEEHGWAVGKATASPEVQTVTTKLDTLKILDPPPGVNYFTLQYGAGESTPRNTTAPLWASEYAEDVQKALNGLAAIRELGGVVTVTRSDFYSDPAHPFTLYFNYHITFGGDLAGHDQEPLILTDYAISVTTEEEGGSVYFVEETSDSPYQHGTRTAVTGKSRTDSVDTDGDGLTDYEEFFLHTNPALKDSDHDGIDDRVEHLGYALGHKVGTEDIGIITTDPLDADTDNDMRSDGDEAELKDIETKRWVVRATGAVKKDEVSTGSAYQVFSNPLVADADFDGLVDGQEFADLDGDGKIDLARFRTDPNNSNTDGDKRDDGVEYNAGTNPLIEDFMVTVFINSITITQDGGWGPDGKDGAFGFDFGVRLPGTGAAGLGDFKSVVHDTLNLTDPFQFALALNDHSVEQYLPLGEPGSHTSDASLKNDDGYDLRLMSWGNGSSVPTSGQGLVVTGTDADGLLHIRNFDLAGVRIDTYEAMKGDVLHLVTADASGTVKSDVLESKLSDAQQAAIAAVKQQLPGWLPPHVLSDSEKDQVLGEAKLITGLGALRFNRGIAFEDANGDHTGDGHPGTILKFARYMKASLRSMNFGLTADQSFSIEGIVAELDLKHVDPEHVYSGDPADYDVHYVYLGGLDGLHADGSGTQGQKDIRPVFRGRDLLAATESFQDFTIAFKTEDNLNPAGEPFAGSISFTIFVG